MVLDHQYRTIGAFCQILYDPRLITENNFEAALEEMRNRVWYLESLSEPMLSIEKVDSKPLDHTHIILSHHPGWVSHASENLVEDNPPLEEYILELVYLHALPKPQ